MAQTVRFVKASVAWNHNTPAPIEIGASLRQPARVRKRKLAGDEPLKPRFTLGAIFVAAALAGCSTTSENDYEVVKTALEGSPKFRADIAGKCAAKIAKQPKSERKALALVVNTSEAKAPRIVCSRAVRAYASGRLTYEDVRMVERGEVTPNIVKILQGR